MSIANPKTVNTPDYQDPDPNPDEVGCDIGHVPGPSLDEEVLDRLRYRSMGGGHDGHRAHPEARGHREDDREGEDDQVHDLVGIREGRRPTHPGSVEHEQLHGHREREQSHAERAPKTTPADRREE